MFAAVPPAAGHRRQPPCPSLPPNHARRTPRQPHRLPRLRADRRPDFRCRAVAYFGFGAANVARDIAVGAGTVAMLQLVRVARQWHRRFAVRFNLCRLAVCLALLFSSAAYHGARGIVKGICLLASNDHLYAPSAISGMALCTLAALALKCVVNRLPSAHFHRAPWLGWGIGLLLTLAAGFFLSVAIQK